MNFNDPHIQVSSEVTLPSFVHSLEVTLEDDAMIPRTPEECDLPEKLAAFNAIDAYLTRVEKIVSLGGLSEQEAQVLSTSLIGIMASTRNLRLTGRFRKPEVILSILKNNARAIKLVGMLGEPGQDHSYRDDFDEMVGAFQSLYENVRDNGETLSPAAEYENEKRSRTGLPPMTQDEVLNFLSSESDFYASVVKGGGQIDEWYFMRVPEPPTHEVVALAVDTSASSREESPSVAVSKTRSRIGDWFRKIWS